MLASYGHRCVKLEDRSSTVIKQNQTTVILFTVSIQYQFTAVSLSVFILEANNGG